MDILLIALTVAAWIVHGIISAAYQSKFKSSKSIQFRLTHAAEIFVTVSIMLAIYHAVRTGSDPSFVHVVAHILGTLIVLDGICVIAVKQLRQRFDIGHFILAYSVIAGAAGLAIALGV